LSQRPHIFSAIPIKTNLLENILSLQIDDKWYKEVKDSIGQDTMIIPRYEGYYLDSDRVLMYNGNIFVREKDELRKLILNEAH
jgi:hypothetical protein